MKKTIKGLRFWCAAFSGVAGMSMTGGAALADDSTRVAGFYENATFVRDGIGLSKFRNTVQLEAEKLFGDVGSFSNVSVNATFRGSYDGVYDLNDDEYGKNAGGPIRLQDAAQGYVDHGDGLSTSNTCLLYTSPSPRDRG